METEDQHVRKVVDLRTRNPKNFSLQFSDFSMIYYDFSKFQQNYCKRTLRSTIHLSHGLRKKDPVLLSIITWGPSSELEAEEAPKALDSGERSHAGGQEAGEKHESITCDRFRARV